MLVHNKCPGGEFYRGGNDFTAIEGDYKLTSDGLVKSTHGVSVNTDPMAVSKFGTPHKIVDIPDGLKIIQRGLNPLHYERVPSSPMTIIEYQTLLSKIIAVPRL